MPFVTPHASDQIAMRASTTPSSSSNRRGTRYSGPACTHPSCKSKSTHSTENCWTRARELAKRADEADARRKASQGARQAEQASQASEFAGNASAFDFTDPHSPLIADAGTDWIADTGATSHITPHRHWFTTYKPL